MRYMPTCVVAVECGGTVIPPWLKDCHLKPLDMRLLQLEFLCSKDLRIRNEAPNVI
jgi:hypothetical protein